MFLQKRKLNKPKETKQRELQNPKILEVNLIKEEAAVSFNWSKNLLMLVFVLFLAGLVVAEVYFGLNWWEKQEAAQIQVLSDKVMKLDEETGKPVVDETEEGLGKDRKVSEEEMKKLSAFYDFINTLDMDDFDKRKS